MRPPLREAPPRAHTPETKPPPDRGGKPSHVLPSRVSSVLAVCLLDLCPRHSKCRAVSVLHLTTSRHSCQDQRNVFYTFLRPPTASRLKACRRSWPTWSKKLPRATIACLTEPSPLAAQHYKVTTSITGCQIAMCLFNLHTAAPLNLPETLGAPSRPQRNEGRIYHSSPGVSNSRYRTSKSPLHGPASL